VCGGCSPPALRLAGEEAGLIFDGITEFSKFTEFLRGNGPSAEGTASSYGLWSPELRRRWARKGYLLNPFNRIDPTAEKEMPAGTAGEG
jgi:hypothetical protein